MKAFLKAFMVEPLAAFLAELAETVPVSLIDRTEFLQRLYAVYCACSNGYADRTIVCPTYDKYMNPWNGGLITREGVRKSAAYILSRDVVVADEYNFFSYPVEFTPSQIVKIKTDKGRLSDCLINRLSLLSGEAWIDEYGFWANEFIDVGETCFEATESQELSSEYFQGLSKRERRALMSMLIRVHVNMMSVPEDEYNTLACLKLVYENMLKDKKLWLSDVNAIA